MPYTHDSGSPVPKNSKNAPNPKLGANELSNAHKTKPSIGFDYRRYEHLLEDSNLNEVQKQEALTALWNIISNFIQLGFGVHPIQHAMDAKGSFSSKCGKLNSKGDGESTDLVFYKSDNNEEGNHATE